MRPEPDSDGRPISAQQRIEIESLCSSLELKGGRLCHRTRTLKQAALMRLAIANYRKAKKLRRAREVRTRRLIELRARE